MKRPCSATTVQGNPCRGAAMEGSDLCPAHAGRVGRKTVLTDELASALVAALSAGNYINVALRAVGVPRQTYHDWMRKGRAGAEPYAAFATRVERALAEGEVRNVALIATEARRTWQAAAWLLERAYPERWGRVSVRLREVEPVTATAPADDGLDESDPFYAIDELAQRRANNR